MQLNANTCAEFNAGACSAPHPSEDTGKPACDVQPSTSTARCPALLALSQGQGLNTTRRFPPGDSSALRTPHSALRDPSTEYRVPSTACRVRSTRVDEGGTRFALMGEGLDCFGGTTYSLIEEIYVLRDGQPVLVKKNSADF